MSSYYIGSAKINEEGQWEGYFVYEDFLYALKMIKEEGGFKEELRYVHTGDFYPQVNYIQKQKPDKNGNTHSLVLSKPYEEKKEEVKGASGTGNLTEEQIKKGKKRIAEQQEEVSLDEIPF